jgi:hypothetical protein
MNLSASCDNSGSVVMVAVQVHGFADVDADADAVARMFSDIDSCSVLV